MISKSDLFYSRERHHLHETPITVDGPVSDRDESDDIYEMAFQHHVLDRPFKAHFKTSDRELSKQKVTHVFHTNFIEPHLLAGERGDIEVGLDAFFEEFVRNPASIDTQHGGNLGPNKVIALIGKVGTGKSTFISHILVRYYRRISALSLFCIRVDVEEFAGRDADKGQFFKQLYLRIASEVSSDFPNDQVFWREFFENTSPAREHDDPTLLAAQYMVSIKATINELRIKQSQRLVLFLDNVDKYYYLFDRAAFSQEGMEARISGMAKLRDIITEFSSRSGKLDGAGICVLVAMRRHTYTFLNYRNVASPLSGNRFDKLMGHSVFRLARVEPRGVLDTRIRLLKKSAELALSPTRAHDLVHLVDLIDKHWRASVDRGIGRQPAKRTMIDDLAKLMHHGHRSLVDQLNKYSWCVRNSIIYNRLMQSYTPIIAMFMLGNLARYSQAQTQFPNLFLVRGEINTFSDDSIPPRLRQPHKHTYWLKFLLLSFVSQRKRAKRAVTVFDVVSCFSDGKASDGYYESHIVELALGSLAQVDGSYCIEPIFDQKSLAGAGISNYDISMTDRGSFLIERFAFDFTYLQLIVEDFMLELPAARELRSFLSDFDLPENLDYRYFLRRFEDYRGQSLQMIRYKAKLVAKFILILEAALDIEIERRSAVFRKLMEQDFELPDFQRIRSDLRGSIKALSVAFEEPNLVEDLEDALSDCEVRKEEVVAVFRRIYLELDS
jgi:hypothetical protein